MKFSLVSALPLRFITKIFFFLIAALTSQAVDNGYYNECSKENRCGSTEIKYPFYKKGNPSECGFKGYEVTCQESMELEYPVFTMNSQSFKIIDINRSTYTINIAREDLFKNIGPVNDNYMNTNISSTFVSSDLCAKNITLFYLCNQDVLEKVQDNQKFTCSNGNDVTVSYEGSRGCTKNIRIPVMKRSWEEFENGLFNLLDLVMAKFVVRYELQTKMAECHYCENSGGRCGTDTTSSQFTCFCKDGTHDSSCPEMLAPSLINSLSNKGKSSVGIYIVGFAGLAGLLLIIPVIVFIVFRCRNKKGNLISSLWESRNISSYGSSLLDLEKSDSYYGVQVFDYKDLQEATNSFDEKKELGDGGFGVVYKGKLQDGRVVAVKRLYERNFKRVEQFMNEVEILARLRHKNLVTLYGCTSRDCRELLLVYEYVSNGTVADHLHSERAKPGALSWTTRINIAVETANALYFLHKKDVIHRDVKTNNILLDSNFCVKVADFGLSRLYPNNVTHVSTAPQGTPGYVDPEYHQCYRLTDKSDVYSFGVVLIELISSMPAVDITRRSHDINLSTMALDKIQNHALHEIVDPNLGFDSDFKIKNMINGVAELAFRCLQNGREMRPSMGEVLEILKTIKSEDHSLNIIEEIEIPGSGDTLSKSDPPAPSPGSTISNSTTSNSSS